MKDNAFYGLGIAIIAFIIGMSVGRHQGYNAVQLSPQVVQVDTVYLYPTVPLTFSQPTKYNFVPLDIIEKKVNSKSAYTYAWYEPTPDSIESQEALVYNE